jgi:aldose 1-epimerase
LAGSEAVFVGETVRAVVLPNRGARLHRLQVLGHDLIRTPPDLAAYDREPFFWGSFVMAPWCNRIGTDPVTVGGRPIQLGSNFADGTAIHGEVLDRQWEILPDGAFRVEAGGDGWPWRYESTLQIAVAEHHLRVDIGLRNLSDDPMPAGLGIHPWFRRPVRVAIRAAAVFSPNADTPPDPRPVEGSLDLRRLQTMRPGLDATWTDLASPPVELAWPQLGIGATMRVTAPSLFIVAASPPGVDAIAVEPQTHAPQGLRRLLQGETGALALLPPGEAMSLKTELEFRTIG